MNQGLTLGFYGRVHAIMEYSCCIVDSLGFSYTPSWNNFNPPPLVSVVQICSNISQNAIIFIFIHESLAFLPLWNISLFLSGNQTDSECVSPVTDEEGVERRLEPNREEGEFMEGGDAPVSSRGKNKR